MTEDGWEEDYTVYEEIPKNTEESSNKDTFSFMPFRDFSSFDARHFTLKVNLEDVSVHIIEAVKYKTHPSLVRRHRLLKQEES
jgi:hypothetical protein